MDSFETWLLRRVAQAVEAGEVPSSLLTELQAEIEAARERPQEEGRAEAVQDIAEKLGIPLKQAEHMLATLEAQPTVTRELLMRRIAEAWLEG
jgi:DNA-directed RNA polymerase specialized sigma subunit